MSSPYRAPIVLIFGAALAYLLALGTIVHDGAGTYVREVNAALLRYDAARSEGDRLLTERDADPRLVDSAAWRQSFERVVQEHQLIHAQLEGLRAPPSADAIQQCLVDGLRLTALGESLLFEAFRADGHQAYYLSAHGNWDLNLGVRDVTRCRASLALIR